jgi:ATP-dependent helicase/nuclease subunit A
VVLLDANHSEAARDDLGILCDWPQGAEAPTHFSSFTRKDERGVARDHLFDAEQAYKTQEDWNLLYVAATRAMHMLIVSGVAGLKNANADGVVEASWYARLQSVPERQIAQNAAHQTTGALLQFWLPVFEPPQLPGPDTAAPALRTDAIEEGVGLHALLERLTRGDTWPIAVPEANAIARWLDCPVALAATVGEQARAILGCAALELFYNPTRYRSAHNELEVAADGKFMRFDRLVIFDDAIWILDYKRQLLDSERAAYQAQLAQYRHAAQAAFPNAVVRSALITVDGQLWEC